MTPTTARAIYCLGVFLLAACAGMPEAKAPAAPVAAVQISATPEVLLAQAIRDRVEVQRLYGPKNVKWKQAEGVESCLREYASRANPHFHRDLIAALSNQLADAMADRTRASFKYGPKHPAMIRAETAVSGLTAAINAEVHNTQG